MKTNENQKSTNHQPAAQKPFFGATPDHAFFSAERAASPPFFQPKAVWQPTQQAKSATSEAEGISQPVVQLLPAFESEINNRDVQRSLFNSPQQLSASPIQAKLTIGQPGDKYEQEADRVASQVVQQINTPASAQSTQGQSLQRQDAAEEEIQTKPSISVLQRSPIPTQVQLEKMPEDEELQAKSILQGRDARGSGEASTDVESAINSARGGGQPLEAGLQQSMGQAMGADFSGVKVHTDSQADQLNQSVQAKAFTTGQDVFFRQEEYNPGSRGGQELIAHELTHVVQQGKEKTKISTKGLSGYLIDRVIQRKPPDDPHVFTYQDKAGRVWSRDQDDKWYRPGDKQGEKIFWSEREDAKAEELIRAEMSLGSEKCLDEQGFLKNADQAVLDDNKFTQYALNPKHERRKEKAKVFESVLG